MIKEQIAYWKNLSPLELWVSVITTVGAWIKTFNWLLLGG
jgi:hypothetical protein